MITSLGPLVEGKLILISSDRWAIVQDKGPHIFVDDLLKKMQGKNVRLILTDLDVLEGLVNIGLKQGQETQFIENMSSEQITQLVKNV